MGEEMMGDEDEDEEDIIEADLEETLDDDDMGEVEIIPCKFSVTENPK
ncbi:hypothetical protein FOC4_g10013184 [Fusarium odoratissimum]|uniref:Uncharacterized protein n=1 Tax=Fusarium oxysporum f. sp. cubense (strain race 4) TaxID=2502994 RepID=N1RLA2_FUSC4|nr:hypothetical protein FOC4_g10013184 [Fusarium odoratissimum]